MLRLDYIIALRGFKISRWKLVSISARRSSWSRDVILTN